MGASKPTPPVWRSMLFVPAHLEKFVTHAHEREADAVILDLEDSVPPALKAQAREALPIHAAGIAAHGIPVLVRINAEVEIAALDIDAVIGPAVRAIVLPKVDRPEKVRAASKHLAVCERRMGLPHGHTRLIAQIEDVAALPRLDAIATASSRLLGMSLGSEDFSVSAGMAATPTTLLWPNQMVAFACRRAGILPLGFPCSIADYSDLQSFAAQIQLANELGFVGAFCIHPAQVLVLNANFSPSVKEVEDARALIATYDTALREGRGAAEFRGKMVDAPVAARAREILRRATLPMSGQTTSQETTHDPRSPTIS